MEGSDYPILISVFLRGGCDALNLVMPIAGPDRAVYEGLRPEIHIASSGDAAAIPLDETFGLHPSATALGELYQDGRLAVVMAAGMHVDTRSHFDAQLYMELGTPDVKTTASGWMARHLATAPGMPQVIMMPALSAGNSQAVSLRGCNAALTVSSPDSFQLNTGPWRWRDAQRAALRHLYGGSNWLHLAGTQALDALDIIESVDTDDYVPANGAVYPNTSFGRLMRMVAQLIKLPLGVRAVAVDLNGWDTHQNQGTGASGTYAGLVGQLSDGLGALCADLDGPEGGYYFDRTTVVVMSEFGRRARENADRGTDHGHGGHMFVAGGAVNGGLYGAWPGLAHDALYDGADLAVTTDYRRVLSEILIRRHANPFLGIVFPGYRDYQPLGIVQGADLDPIYEEPEEPDASYSVHVPVVIVP